MPIVRYVQKFSKRLDLPDSILLDESQSLNLCPDRRDIFCNHMIQTLHYQSHGFNLLNCREWTALGKPSDSSFLLDVDNVDDYVGSNFPGNQCTI
jgi:hypothetical protein